MTATREDVYEAIEIIQRVTDREYLKLLQKAVNHQWINIEIPLESIKEAE